MKIKRRNLFNSIAFFLLASCPPFAVSPHGQLNAQDAIPEVVVSGLRMPSAVVVQPNTGHVFVADSGAQRIVRVFKGKIDPVIVDFPVEKRGRGLTDNVGPLGLLFLDEDTLIVGGGGLPDGEELLRVFKVPSQGDPPIKAIDVFGDAMKLAKNETDSGEGDFCGLAQGSKGIYVTCNGNNQKGWVSLASLDAKNQLKEFERMIATREATFVKAPSAVTISPQGYVTVAQMGEVKNEQDSLLTFYSEAGVTLGVYRTGLFDITGLAYGPKHGRLFATDFCWANPEKGGLYKLVDTKKDSECEAVLMTNLERPTSLAFNKSGDCFVTLAGSAKPDGPADGKLVIIRKLDVDPNK